LVVLPFSLFCLENRVCFSHGVQVAGAAWWAAMRIMTGVGDLVQRSEDDHTGEVLDGRMIGRSGDTVCSLHRARRDEECRFLG
jgi:predicted alpha/beta superfamily hydrolase